MNIDTEDWDALFRAVLVRLRQAVGEVKVVMPGPKVTDPACLIQTIVMECVGALEQLHTALKQERSEKQ